MTISQIIEKFQSGNWMDRACKILTNPKKIKKVLFAVSNCLTKKGLRGVVESIRVMHRYVNDVVTGRYQDYDKTSVTIIVAALIYLVSPFDLIPDVIPVVGYLDDATVIGWAIKEVTDEINRFKEWEKSKLN